MIGALCLAKFHFEGERPNPINRESDLSQKVTPFRRVLTNLCPAVGLPAIDSPGGPKNGATVETVAPVLPHQPTDQNL